MNDIERIEEYFINLKKPYGEYHTVDYHDIDMSWINPCLHQFEGQATDDSIYVVANSTYRSIGFLHVEVDVYIAMTALGIDKKLIELIKYSPKEDYKPYQIMFIHNDYLYMKSEYIDLALNNNITDVDIIILDIILHRCMRYHKNIPAFEKLLNKHGNVNIITKLLDERTYDGNNLAYTGEYRILMLRWMNEHSVEEGIGL